MKGLKIAAVLPRYGESLGGGAETLVKTLLETAAKRGSLIESLEVWTTCALDHRTWENALPPGKTIENGIAVHRFLVDERDLEVFLKAEMAIQDGLYVSSTQQLDWLANSVNSSRLYQHIALNADRVDYIFFAPYLFATSFWGSLICPEKTVLLPCLHDEAYAYLPVFKTVFSKVKGLIFNAEAERELALQIYKLPEIMDRSAVVGLGFHGLAVESKIDNSKINDSQLGDSGSTFPEEAKQPYLLYSGRKEQGKNLDLLIEYYVKWRESFHSPKDCPNLLLIGAGEIGFLEELPAGVLDLGFVSEDLKHQLFSSALALCQPSKNESFSIVMMEAWLHSCPVLVHGECPVTRGHVVESAGGLFFTNFEEFSVVLTKLLAEEEFRKKLGQNGKSYVETKYNWGEVVGRLESALIKFSSGGLEDKAVIGKAT